MSNSPAPKAISDNLLNCDVIFRGGITSGVIYPGTVAGLAKRYRLRQIGGASAGAIAAGIAAAAEYKRQQGDDAAFDRVAPLASKISGGKGSDTNLRTLFRAQRPLWILDTLMWLGMRLGSLWAPVAAVLVPAAALAFVVARLAWLDTAWSIIAGVVAAAVAVGVVVWQITVVLPKLGFGLCSGINTSVAQNSEAMRKQGALMDWIHATIQDLAGRTAGAVLPAQASLEEIKPGDKVKIAPADRPLTMGDLWGTDDASGARQVELVLTTTNLSQQLPHQFPFLERARGELYFRPEEIARYIPRDVAVWLTASARPLPDKIAAKNKGFLRLPEPKDLPVLLGVRLSLSFPGLIAAVPLYAENHNKALREKRSADDTGGTLSRCWFSDGGITSNFPIHLFDSVLPTRPTFCVDLRDATSESTAISEDLDPVERAGVGSDPMIWMPRNNRDDIAPRFAPAFDSMLGFIMAIISTARNGQENELMMMPGHRDRIVHIETSKEEGGLNLHMPSETIVELSERGERAAELLKSRFDPEGVASKAGFLMNWNNHRWIRFRSTVAALERLLVDFDRGWNSGGAGNFSLAQAMARWNPDDPSSDDAVKPGCRTTPGYKWASVREANTARDATNQIATLAAAIRALAASLPQPAHGPASVFDHHASASGDIKRGAPRPKLTLKLRPAGEDPHCAATYPEAHPQLPPIAAAATPQP